MTQAQSTASHSYQRWDGDLGRGWWTWRAIVWNGLKLAVKQQRNKNLLLMSVLFTLMIGLTLYVIRLLEDVMGTGQARGLMDFIKTFLGVDLSGLREIGEYREALWRTLFLVIVKMQQWWVVIVVAFVGPGLIANDIKSRALPIYFAKPVTPATYIFGKWMVVAVFIGAVTFIPNLCGLLLGIIVTGGLETWGQVSSLAFDLAVSGVGQTVLAGMVILALSSLTSDQRYVSVGWIAVHVLPPVVQKIVEEMVELDRLRGWFGSLSIYRDIIVLNDWLFNVRQIWSSTSLPDEVFDKAIVPPMELFYPAVVLGAITVGAIALCYWRVVRFSRAAANM